MVIFSCGQFFAHVAVNSTCTLIIFSLTSYFHASNTLREIRKNMYCVGVFAFTEVNPIAIIIFFFFFFLVLCCMFTMGELIYPILALGVNIIRKRINEK